MKTIKVPAVIWVLGDVTQATTSGVTVSTRPLYYCPKHSAQVIHIGDINPDYAEPLMVALGRAKPR